MKKDIIFLKKIIDMFNYQIELYHPMNKKIFTDQYLIKRKLMLLNISVLNRKLKLMRNVI